MRIAAGGFEGWMRRERNREVTRFCTLIAVVVAAFAWYTCGR